MVKSAKQAIDILGGVVPVAEICGVGRNAVSNWFLRGIPRKHYPSLEPRLRKAKCKFKLNDLFALDPPKQNGGKA